MQKRRRLSSTGPGHVRDPQLMTVILSGPTPASSPCIPNGMNVGAAARRPAAAGASGAAGPAAKSQIAVRSKSQHSGRTSRSIEIALPEIRGEGGGKLLAGLPRQRACRQQPQGLPRLGRRRRVARQQPWLRGRRRPVRQQPSGLQRAQRWRRPRRPPSLPERRGRCGATGGAARGSLPTHAGGGRSARQARTPRTPRPACF